MICNYLNANTCHVTSTSAGALECAATDDSVDELLVYAYHEGWFIPIPADDLTAHEEGWKRLGLGPEFSKLMHYAKAQGCDLVRLDCEAPVLEGLEVFEW